MICRCHFTPIGEGGMEGYQLNDLYYYEVVEDKIAVYLERINSTTKYPLDPNYHDLISKTLFNRHFEPAEEESLGQLEDRSTYQILSRYAEGERDFKSIDLSNRQLCGCTLDYVNLSNANLSYTNLSHASVQNARLAFANLKDVNLSDATLNNSSFANACLKGANFTGARLKGVIFAASVLEGANFTGAILRNASFGKSSLHGVKFDYQIEDGLLHRIRDVVLEDTENLDMQSWNNADSVGCGSSKCISGWAVHLAKNGEALWRKYNYEVAGLMLLGAEAHSHFFNGNDETIAWLKTI